MDLRNRIVRASATAAAGLAFARLQHRLDLFIALVALWVAIGPQPASGSPALALEWKNLTPAQQCVLAAPAVRAPEARFSFDNLPGPQFAESQKQSQRDAAKRVVATVLEAFRSGAASVRIPPGDYRFGSERWDRDGVVYALELSGLRREGEHTFTIHPRSAEYMRARKKAFMPSIS